MPRGLAPDTCFLSMRSGDYRASSGLEERFFIFSGLGSVFLLSQSMSDTARVGRKASSWHRLDGKVSAYLQVVTSAFRTCFSAVHMSSALYLPDFRLSLFIISFFL